MFVVRGVNLFPSSIEAILGRFASVRNFRINLAKRGVLDEISLEIDVDSDQVPAIEEALQVQLGLRIGVQVASPGSLPAFDGKSQASPAISLVEIEPVDRLHNEQLVPPTLYRQLLSNLYALAPIFLPQSSCTTRVAFPVPHCKSEEEPLPDVLPKQYRILQLADKIERSNAKHECCFFLRSIFCP